MGADAVHSKLENFMWSHKASGADMLDPTSRNPVRPSEVTIIKQSNFGLGTARPEVVAKVAARHAGQDLPLISALLPRNLQQIADSSSSQGPVKRQANDGAQVHAVSEYRGTWEEAPEVQKNSGVMSKLSRFQRRVCFAGLLYFCACLHKFVLCLCKLFNVQLLCLQCIRKNFRLCHPPYTHL
jgi:hypothetical protein